MNDVKRYIEENESRFLDELFSLIRIPSVSAYSEHKAECGLVRKDGKNSCWKPVLTGRM